MTTTREKPLAGKVALVTGGSRGIGAAIAKRLATDGAIVAITYTQGAAPAQSVVKGIEGAGGKAIAIQADAADANAVKAAVEKTVATFGRLDVLVNNAGTAIPKPFEETTLEEMDRVIDINIRGVFVATQAALKHMKEGSRIINIGSCVGERLMTPGLVPYSATKGAVKMFTQGLARELGGRAITVNNIQPGPINTDLNPAVGDWATPQIANTAARNAMAALTTLPYMVWLRCRAGSLVHHRREPDCRRRHQCLTANGQWRGFSRQQFRLSRDIGS